MKRKPLVTWFPFQFVMLIAPLMAAWPQRAEAAGGTWNVDAAGNWSTTTNWTPAAVPGTAAGDVINLTNNITVARTVTIDTTSRTAGDLNIGDATAPLFGFTLASSATTVVLNLDGVGAADATVDFQAGVANTISAPLTLLDNAQFRSNTAFVQTLSGVIAGAKSVTFNNDTDGVVNAPTATAGQFLVTGNNTYTGGTTISDVRVNMTTNNTALGAAGSAVTIQPGGQLYASTALSTINYAFNIAGNGWAEAVATVGQPLGALRLEGGAVVTGNVAMSANAGIGGNTGTGTVNGVISGTGFTLSKRGGSTLILGGANTYTGGTNVTGVLQLNNNSAAGTGAITLDNTTAAGTNTLLPTRLLVGGGVTVGNVVNIGNTTGLAATGLLQQTGTGQGRFNGPINVTGSATAGGHFQGGAAVGNELVLGGAINSTVASLSQRDGRVVYAGAGTGGSWNALSVTGTALVGATNGIPTAVAVTMGGSANGTLDLNGFNQTLASATLGNAGLNSAFTGTIALGAGTLTLNGDITTLNTGTGNATNAITAAAGGTINFGATPRNISVADNSAVDDLVITNATIAGSGVTKTGLGTLALRDATFSAPLTVSAGTLATGTNSAVGSATLSGLAFTGTTALRMKVGAAGDQITVSGAGGLTTGGTTAVSLNQVGGILANGNYNLINYTGASPGLSGFTLNPVGHSTSALIDTGTAIALQVTANDKVIWDGTASGAWTTAAIGNWKLATPLTATDYIESDDVVFNDMPTTAAVTIASNVTPSNVTFNNTTATTYSVTGAGGIAGTTGLTKNGSGTVTLATPNTYTGATIVNAGTLAANYSTATALSAASPITIAGGATLRLEHAGGTFALSNTISGAGTVIVDPSTTTAGPRDLATVNWNAAGFTGTLRLAPTLGTMRIQVDTPADLGNATVEVASGAQVFFNAANQTIANNFTISGTGYQESGGFLGAIRSGSPTTFTGAITLSGAAKIGALAGVMNMTNTLGGGILTFGGSLTSTNSEVLNITGNAGGLTGLVVNDGLATAGLTSIAVNVGNNTASGTLGNVPVSLLADGFKNSVIRFDRTDGYTLGGAITSTSAVANHVRTFVDADSQGTGFSDGGLAINLGGTSGGQFRVGQNRANSVAHLSGALTAGTFLVGANVSGAVANLNSGAVVNVGTARLGTGGAINATSTLNINSGASFTAFSLGLGEVVSANAVVNQAGGTVNIDSQLRVAHFGSLTATYNMNGGTLTMTGASPTLSPSTSGTGAANATGDNNINALATPALVGGGIYVGTDGAGIFNHNAGTVTTNWMVLDNRGASGAGSNMVDGIDAYNLNGGTLNLRSNWGLIGRNEGSYKVNFGGGTVRVDNTGTGTGTGPNITVPLDAVINAVASTTTTLDTNAAVNAGNAFTLTKDVTGTGTLALTGGGAVNFSTTGQQSISAAVTGSNNIFKLGAGTTTLTGDYTGHTGTVNVAAGRLNLPAASGPAIVTVGDGAAIGGEPAAMTSLTLGSTTGSTIFFDPNTPAALTTTNLIVNGTNNIDVTSAPVAAGPYDVINFTNRSGAGTFAVANPGNYRTTPVVTETSSKVQINLTAGLDLTWTGAASTAWNINTAANWNNPTPTSVFFNLDKVTFPEGGLNTSVALAGLLAPASVTVNASTTPYTLTSTTGNQLTGGTAINKTGAGTLTLVGPNTHTGTTSVGGGVVNFSDPASLGSGGANNGIALSGGGILRYTGAVSGNLGVNRNISVGAGGGSLSHSNATAATLTVSGNLSGSGPLNLSSQLAGGGTFLLTGSNAGYTGPITVGSVGTGTTTLAIGSPASLPAASSITLNHPAAGANGALTTLGLVGGTTMPATTTINMTAALPSTAISQRSQILSSGPVTIDSPITLAGDGIIQLFANAGSTLTQNGNIRETAPGSFVQSPLQTFSNVLFLRGGAASTVVLNGQINLPSAGSTVSVTDGTTALLNNATGNDYKSAGAVFGTLRLGANNAIPTTARLVVGQPGDQAATLDLNGFNQTVTGLEWQAITGNLLTKGISNTHVTATSTFTINQATAPVATSFNGTISGRTNLVKEGAATTTLAAAASNFTGNVTVNAGTLVASTAAASGAASTLGAANVAGKTVTVNNTGTVLSFTANNIFGNGVGNANLPKVIINQGATLSSTRYNVLGELELNGGTLTQAATDGPGLFEGFALRGNVTVGGTAASGILTTNGKGTHLGSNTTFTVADATGNAAIDLNINTPLRNPSGDFVGTGGLTKAGPGTLSLAAGVTSSYTGATVVSEGVLNVNGSIATSSSLTVSAGATVSGAGTLPASVTFAAGAVFAPGNSPGTVTTTGNVSFASTSVLEYDFLGTNTAVGGPDNDLLTGVINLTLDGVLNVTENTAGSFLSASLGDRWRIINYTGTLTDNGLTIGGTMPALSGSNMFAVDTSIAGQVNLVVVAVPETSSAALIGLTTLVTLRRRRRAVCG
jgi:fibronectin-binding autotransporter adhesin